MSLVRLHRIVTTVLALALAALAAWRGEAFLARRDWGDLLLTALTAPASLGLVVYLARLNRVLHREPGPGTPRDVGR